MTKVFLRERDDGIYFHFSNTGIYKMDEKDNNVKNLGEIPGTVLPGSRDPNKTISSMRKYIGNTEKQIKNYEKKLRETIEKKTAYENMLREIEEIIEKHGRILEKPNITLGD